MNDFVVDPSVIWLFDTWYNETFFSSFIEDRRDHPAFEFAKNLKDLEKIILYFLKRDCYELECLVLLNFLYPSKEFEEVESGKLNELIKKWIDFLEDKK